MRFLHTGDWHVGKTLRGRSRSEEHRDVLAEMAGIARDRKVDVVLVAGDLFDTAAPGPESEEIVYRALLDFSRSCEWVVLISGNHDNPRRLEAVEPLMRLTNIRALAKPARPSEGGVLTLETKAGTASIALLPFLSQRSIVKANDLMTKEASQHTGDYAERASAILAELCAALPPGTVRVLLAHAMVYGGVLGGGERAAHTIFEYAIPATAFPGSIQYAAVGHLHRAQRLPAASPAWYSGSPLQLDFGETEDVKSVNLVEAEPDSPAEVEVVPLKSGRALRRVRGSLAEIERMSKEGFGDAYLQVEVAADPTPGLADKVREVLPNTVEVLLKAKGQGLEELPKEPRIGRSPRDLFAEYLKERGAFDPRVLALFQELLEQVHASD
jgi:exonuclease SbcD